MTMFRSTPMVLAALVSLSLGPASADVTPVKTAEPERQVLQCFQDGVLIISVPFEKGGPDIEPRLDGRLVFTGISTTGRGQKVWASRDTACVILPDPKE